MRDGARTRRSSFWYNRAQSLPVAFGWSLLRHGSGIRYRMHRREHDCRLNNLVLNRLNKPSDGDIIVPQRATSVIGTTSWAVENPALITIPPEHVDRMITQGEQLI